MRMVGLTGGIASGKSTVSIELQSLRLPVIDADKVAHAALKKGTMGWKRVVATFGKEILLENGEVDRARLGNIIFGDPAKRKSLNSALSLSITLGIFWNLLKYWIVGTKVVILDVPLLFETKFRKITKPIIVVWVDAATQLERLMKRDNISKEQALNKINSQLSLDWKHDQADFVIDNSGSLEATKVQVHEVWTHITTPLTWKELLFSRSVVVAVIAVAVLFWIFKR